MLKFKTKTAVFMPAYNAEKYIENAINSVIEQTDDDFIIIVGDDCSSDNTVAKVKSIMQIESRLVLNVNKSNLGQVGNFNLMLDFIEESIECKYIAFFSGDDMMLKNRLELSCRALENHPNAGFLFCPSYVLNHKGAYELNKSIVGTYQELSCVLPYHTLVKKPFPFVTNGAFVRKDMIANTRYKSGVCSDFRFFIDMAMEHEKEILYFHQSLSIYRRHQGGVTSKLKLSGLIMGSLQYYIKLIKKYPSFCVYISASMIKVFFTGLINWYKSWRNYG